MARELVEIDYDKIVRETDLAYLFSIGDEDVWIPKSQVDALDDEDKTFSIPEWIAEEKGLI